MAMPKMHLMITIEDENLNKNKKEISFWLISFAFGTPAESRTHADNQQVANYFVTNPHLVTNSFQTGNKRLKISSLSISLYRTLYL